MQPTNELISKLHLAAASIEPPKSLLSGLRCRQGLSPDNVVIHRRAGMAREKETANFHHRFELALALGEGGAVRIGEATFRLDPGEGALIFPHQFHHYQNAPSGPSEWLCITFDLSQPLAASALRDRPVALDAEALRLADRLVEGYRRGLPTDPLGVAYHLALLLARLLEAAPVPKERRAGPDPADVRDVIVRKINAYVRQNLRNAPSLEELAGKLGYSASRLRTVFRDKLGVTLGLYIRESRLAEAARLLLTSDRTVSEVARETGFTSLNAFSRAFAAYYKIAPKSYALHYAPPKAKLRNKPANAAARKG
ncbi:MAG: AraC family transcriptional regulator [Chthoniobacteraceae bacterium]